MGSTDLPNWDTQNVPDLVYLSWEKGKIIINFEADIFSLCLYMSIGA